MISFNSTLNQLSCTVTVDLWCNKYNIGEESFNYGFLYNPRIQGKMGFLFGDDVCIECKLYMDMNVSAGTYNTTSVINNSLP